MEVQGDLNNEYSKEDSAQSPSGRNIDHIPED